MQLGGVNLSFLILNPKATPSFYYFIRTIKCLSPKLATRSMIIALMLMWMTGGLSQKICGQHDAYTRAIFFAAFNLQLAIQLRNSLTDIA